MTIHETEQDRTNEMLVAMKLSDKWVCDMEEMPLLHHFDFKGRRNGQTLSIIEIKCRKISSTKYKEYMIDKEKIDKIMSDSLKHDVTPLLVVQFTDRTRFCVLVGNYPAGLGGPNPPRDENDITMCYFIPSDHFKTIY